jgi:hypothetical protein
MSKLEELWTEAYKLSHALSEITERHLAGKEIDHEWLVDYSRQLNCVAQAIKSHTVGERTESVRHD